MECSLGFAVFGAGRIGTVHISNLFLMEGVEIKYVVEEDLARAEKLVKQYRLDNSTRVISMQDSQTALSDPDVKAVIICTPSFTHEKIINLALDAGKTIFCEKPLAPSLEDMKKCYERAAAMNINLFCAFNRRFDPQLRNMRNKIKNGDIGAIRMVRCVSRDPAPMTPEYYVKTAGGIHLDSSVHDIDMACWIVGEKPVSVFSYGHATNELFSKYGDVDTSAIMLKFPGGAVAMIENSRYACTGHDQRVEVFGNKGLLLSENQRATSMVAINDAGAQLDPIYPECCSRYMESYKHEMNHFFNVLKGKEEMEVTDDSTLMVNTIAMAATKSMKSGQPITLTW